MLLGVAGAAGLAALVLIWQGMRSHVRAPAAATESATRESGDSAPGIPHSAVALAARQPALGGGEQAPSSGIGTPASSGSAQPKAELAADARSPSIPVSSEPAPAANALPAAPSEAPLPAPPAIRLQAIVFHPTRPSAMINGKTLFLGDMLGEMQLVAIGRESATLVGAGQTNLLTLR
jgi:hypothetical protein